MAHADDAHAADVFDFVDAYAAALERGEERTLAYWLARFPASQDAIAHEWLALRRPVDGVHADPAVAPTINGPDRIGPYRLISELGRGGQGTVFLAEDTRILRRVALKVLASRFDTIRDDKLRRFRREAEIIARLEHPSLCTVYEADLEGEVPYLAMRYVEGRTLADVLADAKKQDESSETVHLDSGDDTTPRATAAHFPPRSKLELDQVLLFFERAARALHAAHEAGVVHRDVKPGNMIVTTDGKPVLLDFGLARDESETDASRITESGEVFGTPSYMSPEQLQFASDALDRRTDVYSLGVALYEALTLHRPFEQAARPALYLAIQSQMPPDPRSFNAYLPEDVAVVIETALEKDRARRYATALALAEDLRRIRQFEPIRARPAGVGLRFSRWVRRHPAVAAATIGTILSLSAGLIVALLALNQKDAALSVALGKHLAQRSIELVNEDAGAALALGIMAAERAPGYQTMSSLYPALDGCWLEHALGGDPTSKLMSDLAVDPRGKYVIGAFPDGVAHVWTLQGGQRVMSIDPGHGAIDVLDVDPAGARVALAAIDGSITIVSFPESKDAFTVGTGERATRVEFSSDGTFLLVRAATGVVRVVNTASRSTVGEARGPFIDARWIADDRIALFPAAGVAIADARLVGADSPRIGGANTLAADVSADGRRLALALVDGTIEVRDATSLELVARATGLASPVRSLQLSPAGDRVALRIGDEDRAAPWLWNLGSEPRELRDAGSRGVAKLRFSPDGERIASVGASTIVHVWDTHSGELTRTFRLVKRQLEAAWSPDGSRLVTSTAGFAYVWFARARPDTFDLEGHAGVVRTVRVANDGERLLSASADGTARIWSIATGTLVQALPHGAPLVDARFVDSGALVVTAGEDGVVRAWDARSGTSLSATASLDVTSFSTTASLGATTQIPGGIASIAAQDASALVAIVGRNGAAYAWDATAPGTLTALELSPDAAAATCTTCLSNPARIAWGFADGRVVVVDSLSLRPLTDHRFQHAASEPCAIVALDAARDGAELAVGCSDQFVRFWRPGERAESRPDRKGFYLRAVEWDPRGERVLALGLEPGTKAVHVLDAAADKRITPRNAHRANITCAAFSPDGMQVATGAADGSVFVWNALDGAPSVQRTDLGASVRSLTFVHGAGGPSIAAGLEDGRIRVWPLDPLFAARARQPRALDDWELDRERALAAPLPFD